MSELNIEDIMGLIEIEDEAMRIYIKNYLEVEDELRALQMSNLMVNDLLNFKNNYEFVSIMKLIEDHKIRKVEKILYNMAEEEDIKAIEFLLKNRSDNFNKKEAHSEGVIDVHKLLEG